jgi:hypothetical protein
MQIRNRYKNDNASHETDKKYTKVTKITKKFKKLTDYISVDQANTY